MINQDRLLSDEELRSRITKARKERDLHLMDESDYADFIIDLINAQKRLYAESVIGNKRYANIHEQPNDVWLQTTGQNQLIDEQKSRIK